MEGSPKLASTSRLSASTPVPARSDGRIPVPVNRLAGARDRSLIFLVEKITAPEVPAGSGRPSEPRLGIDPTATSEPSDCSDSVAAAVTPSAVIWPAAVIETVLAPPPDAGRSDTVSERLSSVSGTPENGVQPLKADVVSTNDAEPGSMQAPALACTGGRLPGSETVALPARFSQIGWLEPPPLANSGAQACGGVALEKSALSALICTSCCPPELKLHGLGRLSLTSKVMLPCWSVTAPLSVAPLSETPGGSQDGFCTPPLSCAVADQLSESS